MRSLLQYVTLLLLLVVFQVKVTEEFEAEHIIILESRREVVPSTFSLLTDGASMTATESRI